ncbi:MAG: bifunctional folylpolyglutamate synthase/dihydrofolate synthase, partial [Roseiflexaceae bacterium]|nr:bifunctional folylpolyglutamate synthase/dihydrofolate synthase [Roseiflexaceae bacterium]
IAGQPTVVLDGAHNGDSARRLAEALREQFPRRCIVLVFGTTRDKDIARMFAELLPLVDALVLTRSRHPRAETSLAELAAQARPYLRRGERNAPLVEASDIPEAFAQAQALADPGDLIVITGSLFVVAAAREHLGLAPDRDDH